MVHFGWTWGSLFLLFGLFQFLYLADVLQWRAQTTPDHPLFLLLNSKVSCTLGHTWRLRSVKPCLCSKKIIASSLFQKCCGYFDEADKNCSLAKQHSFLTAGIVFHIFYSISEISVWILPILKHCSNYISCWNTTFCHINESNNSVFVPGHKDMWKSEMKDLFFFRA